MADQQATAETVVEEPVPSCPPNARAKPLPREPVARPLPDVVPARMINEVLYCDRLMFLEWARGEWADNYFTADGRSVHKRADQSGKPLQPAAAIAEDGEPLPYTARSVWLSSERLGITAKIDVVDVEGDQVVPVEYKRGKRPDIIDGAYPPERAQVCAQVLLLREHGFRCDHGDIYFAKDRQRHSIQITEGLITQTLDAVSRIRELVSQDQLPPPLEDSPKCNGCSLVGICLPDETRALEEGTWQPEPPEPDVLDLPAMDAGDDPWDLTGPVPEVPVRRLFPARDDRLPVYVQEQGSSLRLSGERLVMQRRDGPATEARLANTSHVALFGNVHITTPAIKALLERSIPLLFFSYGGWYQGRTMGPDSKNVALRVAQYETTMSPQMCLRLAHGFVASKILNCRTLLRRNHTNAPPVVLSELKQLARKAHHADAIASLLGIEGTAARTYFSEFTGMLKGDAERDFDFEGRNRRPPRDPVNALLSFCYSLLTKEVLMAVMAAGLDSMLGFYHQHHFGRPSLALDLMEEFRPIIADSVVINALNTGVIQPDDFVRGAGAVNLTTAARKRLILAFERRMDQLVTHPVFDYRISYRRVLEVQARLLSRFILHEVKYYPAFRVR